MFVYIFRMLVDLLKLAVAGRCSDRSRESLSMVLSSLGATKAELGITTIPVESNCYAYAVERKNFCQARDHPAMVTTNQPSPMYTE